MMSPSHIPRFAFLLIARIIMACLISSFAAGCATKAVVLPSALEAHPRAISVPYRISEAGHFLIDVSVNGRAATPFIIDSGANASAIYESHIQDFGLSLSGQETSVSGLVATAMRPVTGPAALQIGPQTFQPSKLVILETSLKSNDVAGLLGVDVLADYALLFNKTSGAATLIPSAALDRDDFAGWHRIALRNSVGGFPDKGLYFARILLKGQPAPVLIDTGSSLNFVNWELATQDEAIAKLRRSLRKAIKLQGAVDDADLRLRANFFDVQLGKKKWSEVDVVVLEFDTLTDIAPVNRPMMLAGAPLFSPSTFAFDFGGNAIYIKPEAEPPK